MGYNKSLNVITRMQPVLNQIHEAVTDKVALRFESETPHTFAYKIREAINACRYHADHIPYYEFVWPRIEVKEIPHGVLISYIGIPQSYEIQGKKVMSRGPVPEESQPAPRIATATPASMNRPISKRFPEVASLTDVVAAALNFPNEQEIFFPAAMLTEDERILLYKWTVSEAGSRWTYINHGESDGLTLTQNDVPEGVGFSP